MGYDFLMKGFSDKPYFVNFSLSLVEICRPVSFRSDARTANGSLLVIVLKTNGANESKKGGNYQKKMNLFFPFRFLSVVVGVRLL